MRAEKERAATSAQGTAAPENEKNAIDTYYTEQPPTLSSQRAEAIAKRRSDMPKVYRGIYDRAVAGRSLRSAVNSFCLECVMWQREEVRLCTSLACPLWPYRPYKLQSRSKNTSEGPDLGSESKKPKD